MLNNQPDAKHGRGKIRELTTALKGEEWLITEWQRVLELYLQRGLTEEAALDDS